MSQTSRRTFLKKTSLLTGAAVSGSILNPYFFNKEEKALADQPPSDRLRMGFVGVGEMGRHNAHTFMELVDIVALCDVDTKYGLERAVESGLGRKNEKGEIITPDTYTDYHRILDRDDIDIVAIATPDHWHVKIAIEALQAGKHVFCQKPLTLTLEENKLIRNACKKYDRVFQVGTQQRSQRDQFMTATLLVRQGKIGRVKKIVCDVGAVSLDMGFEKKDIPEGFDWNMWLGQAPETDFIAGGDWTGVCWRFSRAHRTFRFWYEYSGGNFTDWGAHHIDCALWAVNRQEIGTGPVLVDGTKSTHPVPFKDGYPLVDNRFNTSDSFDIVLTFEDGMELHVVNESPDGNGILFEGTEGRFHVNRERIKGKVVESGVQNTLKPEDFVQLYHGKPLEYHEMNFIRCIREGGTPVSDVFSHVLAMNCCHLCGIAARLQRVIKWDSVKEEIVDDPQAASFQAREQRKGFEIPRD